MKLELAVQYATELNDSPCERTIERWALAALVKAQHVEPAELTVRVVDTAESRHLNETYRHQFGSTNVLSFPFTAPVPELQTALLGDIVICAPVVAREAKAQHKALEAHWAHLVVHGVLHLLGYDHQQESQARVMEQLEVETLATLGYSNPYSDAIFL